MAAAAQGEISAVYRILLDVSRDPEGSALVAMTRPELTAPTAVSELRLLQVLRVAGVADRGGGGIDVTGRRAEEAAALVSAAAAISARVVVVVERTLERRRVA